MNFSSVLQSWEQIPETARIDRPTNEAEFETLLELLESITDRMEARAENPENSSLGALFDLVSEYVRAWEAEYEPEIDATPGEVLEQLMLERGVTQTDLERAGVAKQELLSMVLAGKREVSRALAKKLAAFFAVSVELFV
jgi:HTH-type transcriptional regulator / antitoxin HigA